MKFYLKPLLIPVEFENKDVMALSTQAFGDDNFMDDTLTPDDM